jgi:hypothetical protein
MMTLGETKSIVGLKLLAADGGSLNSEYGRIIYPEGEWVEVPGLGAFVAISDGVFSGGVGPLIAFMECDLASEIGSIYLDGVRCFRRVRRLRREEERLEALDIRIRWIATLWRNTDQSKLEQLAYEDDDWRVREVAVYGITDLSVLERIANNDSEWSVRHTALCRIKQLNPGGKI